MTKAMLHRKRRNCMVSRRVSSPLAVIVVVGCNAVEPVCLPCDVRRISLTTPSRPLSADVSLVLAHSASAMRCGRREFQFSA